MFGESKNQYVSRKLKAWQKEERREHEADGVPVDADEFRHDSIDRKHELEDWWDFVNGENAWPW